MVAIYINNPQLKLFKAMQRMFLSAPREGEMQGKFKQFRNSFGKCQVNFNKNMHRPDLAAKPSTYFLNVFTEDTLVFQKQ